MNKKKKKQNKRATGNVLNHLTNTFSNFPNKIIYRIIIIIFGLQIRFLVNNPINKTIKIIFF